MKNSKLFIIATVIMLGSMSSCIIVEDDYDPIPPPPQLECEIYSTGNVCFENNTDRDMYIETAGTYFDIWSYSRTCVEIPTGYYNFYAVAGPFNWKGGFDVFICDQ